VSRRLLILLSIAATLTPAVASAAEPPNGNDPCSRGGRDSCATTGVGEYRTYRYGVRWFGDYRGAVPEVDGAMFCLDLRFWYPGRAYDFELSSADTLRNREGETVSPQSLRRMSYAIWNFGRTSRRSSQGAVMLYVHRLMGDGAPGEVDPRAGGPAVRAVYERIVRDAERYAAPYRVEVQMPATLAVRRAATATIRVLAASGRALPNVKLTLSSSGAAGLAAAVDTGADGIARVAFKPDGVKGGVRVTATSGQLAAERPRIYAPTRADAARNGQRLAASASAAVSATATAAVQPARLTVTTAAKPATQLADEPNRDGVTIGGAYGGWRGQVEVRLYGPFRSQAAISCAGEPFAASSYETGAGPSMTPPVAPSRPGWYGYQLTIASTDDVLGLTTPCAVPAETFSVQAQPAVTTQISSQTSLAGSAVTDTVAVSGLAGETVTVAAALYGPYAAADKMTCASPPYWAGSFSATADGTYATEPVTLTVPGYYTYRESTAASEFVRAAESACADAAETTIVRGKPAIRTQVSALETAPGTVITDSVVVSGLGGLSATVHVAIHGPFATREAIRCDGAPLSESDLAVTGDGMYTSAPATLAQAGYYTYQESIAATPAYDGVTTTCGDAAETTLVRGRPVLRTVASNAVVRPGSSISDHIEVTGLGTTPATIEVRLYGPFASRAEIGCGGTPYWKGSVDVAGDGKADSAKVVLKRAGFYTYRERIVATPTVAEAETVCAEEAETSLSSPLILTGRGDRASVGQVTAATVRATPPAAPATAPAAPAAAPVAPAAPAAAPVAPADAPAPAALATAQAAGSRPARVRVAARGIDAPVYGVGIDTATGALAIPKSIDRVGWWRDGAAPSAANGAILLAGHVDSAKRGAGAFYALKNARRGDTVSVTSADGKLRNYRISSMVRVRKAALPGSIFSRGGPRRLVLVTCGGPFDAKLGHYRDNIVVTALPR
jgi:hypothetical protein